MKDSILSARGLCKSYAHNGGQNHILNHIDLDIYRGDFTIVMGASGSGKSTLLYTMSGMDSATAGKVIYQGNTITDFKEDKLAKLRRGDFGFVFQQMHLVGNLSLFENVAVTGYLNKSLTASEVDKRANGLLEEMGLSGMSKRLPSQVSGGEQQRAAIARAVINKPCLLFADEPTGALNRKNTVEVLNLLTGLNREGQSILMVTHDIRAALRATRLLYLEDGRIIGELTLPPYEPEEEKARETQVDVWLSSMEW
ncbi:putative ABC transport system ATP-binding protein [Anaerocolumna jejuensis DSM 15929]|uniref:Putative ABC transport system ATP-binding protein n=1 Tax=Anaerocolumna jejuensis DSM 15929 TaxID=1121322 RepID=A0A1M6XY22_9FIRM|nr:ABC transporter ATP-binding protein [Anaerocolumna jejuensis]SHL10904.1 putative ABC transport system ATP-binding protein [Anaerocolumna jejuensis DSM 15929]